MTYKTIDSKDDEIKTLKNLLSKSQSDKQKALIEKDLKLLESGYNAEKENAYYLDFSFADRLLSALLHDIRIEHNGLTAQFDHILITPIGITVLESKSFQGILTINQDGSLTVKTGKYTNTYPNPVEQNNRHIKVLDSFLKDTIDLSARFKLLGGIKIDQRVLIHPHTTITNKKLPEGFERSDSFATKRKQEIDKLGIGQVLLAAAKLITDEMIINIAREIMQAHKPIKFDYTNKYKISDNKTEFIEEPISLQIEEQRQCPKCKEGVLVLRKRKSEKFGAQYQSDEFYGCSRFPKCRYTEEIS